MTIRDSKGRLNGLKTAYVGDGNNVARSLCLGAVAMGMNFSIASPDGYGLGRRNAGRSQKGLRCDRSRVEDSDLALGTRRREPT